MITCELENGTFSFPVSYTMPVEKPKLTFVQINFRPQVSDKHQPTEELVDNGCAVLSFYYEDITTDNGDFSNGLAGVYSQTVYVTTVMTPEKSLCGHGLQ